MATGGRCSGAGLNKDRNLRLTDFHEVHFFIVFPVNANKGRKPTPRNLTATSRFSPLDTTRNISTQAVPFRGGFFFGATHDNIVAITAANAKRWQVAKIAPKRQAEVNAVAVRLAAPAAKARYRAIDAATGVTWFAVAVIHDARPVAVGTGSSGRATCWLSVHVPRGRGRSSITRAMVGGMTPSTERQWMP